MTKQVGNIRVWSVKDYIENKLYYPVISITSSIDSEIRSSVNHCLGTDPIILEEFVSEEFRKTIRNLNYD